MPGRRAHSRLPLPTEATWAGGVVHAEARLVDISLSGCFLESRLLPAPGESLTVAIHFPAAAPVAVKAWVVYIDPGRGFAVRFIDVEEDVQSLLAERLIAHGLANPWDGDASIP